MYVFPTCLAPIIIKGYTSTGSRQDGIRVCISQMNEARQFDLLDQRLAAFAAAHKND